MKCPECHHLESKVVDSRSAIDSIRRRRECLDCAARFTTHERVERQLPWVLKKDGRKEPFRCEKVLKGISLACRKRPIDDASQMEAVRQVEALLIAIPGETVESGVVGRAVMDVLRNMDEVAYLRFASVYQEFESVQQFVDTIRPLREHA